MGTDLNGIAGEISESFGINNRFDVRTCSPLTLAYVGDAIFELIIRTSLVVEEERTVQKYHKKCSEIVKASAQKELFLKIEPLLTEDELSVFKRGRNAKSYSVPKHATPGDYRIATGFEALCGFLYLTGNIDRLLRLITAGMKDHDAD